MQRTTHTPRIIDWRAARELTGLARSTLYALVAKGEIPHLRLAGRILRFDSIELEAWLSSWRRGRDATQTAAKSDQRRGSAKGAR